MKKLAVMFPGIGYTCHKPLLYYGAKVAEQVGYELVRLDYSGFPSGVKGDRDKMRLCFQIALEQVRTSLASIDWAQYEDVVFISKSIGTAVASAYAKEIDVPVRHVLFTPVEETFLVASPQAIAFHGTADPWADTGVIKLKCSELDIPLYLTPDANHSLETGDAMADLREMEKIMGIVKKWIG